MYVYAHYCLQRTDQKDSPSASCADDLWDNGPAGITIAAPVITPTKDSRRSSTSDLKPSLSRVESLSNSFIDDLDYECTSAPLSDAGSVAGDPDDCQLGCEVVDLQPASSPSQSFGATSESYPGIFDLGLKVLASRTASTEVLHGSVAGISDGGSEWSAEQHQQWSAAGRKQLMKSLAGSQATLSQKADSEAAEDKRGASPGSSLIGSQVEADGGSEVALGPVIGVAAAEAVLAPEAPAVSTLVSEATTATAAAAAAVDHPDSSAAAVVAVGDAAEAIPDVDPATGGVGETFAAADDDVAAGAGEGSSLVAAGSGEVEAEAARKVEVPEQASKQEPAKGVAMAASPFAPQPDLWIAESPFTAPSAVVSLAGEPEAAAASAEAPAAKEQPLKVNVQQQQQQPLLEQGSEPERVETPDVQADPSPGFGFSFPVTPPTDEEEHILEARAERVFSTWASSHSRASFEIGGASDDEGERHRGHASDYTSVSSGKGLGIFTQF